MMVSRIMLNASYAPSLVNFRGPLIRDMAAAGVEVVVTAPAIAPDLRAQLSALGAEVYEVPLQRTGQNPLADRKYYSALRRTIARTQPDLVLGYTIKPNIWGSLAARAEGVASASMVTGLGHMFAQPASLRAKVTARAVRWLLARATSANDAVIFQNPDDIAEFIAQGCLEDGAKAHRVHGSGVDCHHFAPVLLPDAPVFLFAGRLLADKGLREFAKAALALKAKRPECRFIIAGDLDEAPSSITREELDQWIAGGIEWLGWVEDMRQAYAKASVFVLPSYREGTPRTVLEAAAMGRAVITTDAPGCRETVVHEQTGLLVPLRDARAIHTAMDALAHDHARRAAYGMAGRAMIEQHYEVSTVNREVMDILGISQKLRP